MFPTIRCQNQFPNEFQQPESLCETALKDVHICSQNKVAFTEEENNFGSAFVLHKTICLKGKPEQILDYLVYSG